MNNGLMTEPTGSMFTLPTDIGSTDMPLPRSANDLAVACTLGLLALQAPSISASAVLYPPQVANERVVITAASTAQDRLLLAIANLHDRLIATSQHLPPEAAKVLYANLWDMYLD